LSLVGPGVDLDQQFSLVHILPFAEIYFHDLPVDAAFDVRRVERRNRAKASQVDRNILFLHWSSRNGNGARCGRLRLLLFGVGTAAAAQGEGTDGHRRKGYS